VKIVHLNANGLSKLSFYKCKLIASMIKCATIVSAHFN